MVQCPRCDTANPATNRYCDRCGSALLPTNYTTANDTPFPSEYIPYPNYDSFPPPEYDTSVPPPPPLHQQYPPSRPKITLFWIIRAILYFAAVFVAGFGLTGAFIYISNSNDTMTGLGIFFWLGLMVAAVVLFIRTRHRTQRLRFWPFIGWISGATVGAIMATILDTTFFSDFSKTPVGPFILACIVLLYGLIMAGAALW